MIHNFLLIQRWLGNKANPNTLPIIITSIALIAIGLLFLLNQ